MEGANSAINLTSLKPWFIPLSDELIDSQTQSCGYDENKFRFQVSSDLNKKIFLCQGGISQLKLDCVVLPINEMTLTKSPLATEVHRAAGISLAQYYNTLKGLKTGNVELGSGFDLPSRYIIHVMEPGMNAKFKSAVENALHRCYHNVLQLAVENKLKMIGFSSLYENVTYLLNEEMTHMALGTVRCFMEKHADHFDAIVFSVGKSDLDLYLKLLPAYFPRSTSEAEQASCHLATRNIGEWGDRINEDRAIRILHLPLNETNSSNNTEGSFTPEDNLDSVNYCLKTHSFSSMEGDHDSRRKKEINELEGQKSSVARERIYRRLLLLSRSENFSNLVATRSLYVCGKDRQGDSIVVVVANRINMNQIDLEKVLLFHIRTLDPVVNDKFSIVYFHTMAQSHNHPSISFIKRIYNVLDDRYRNNLKRFFMVHPSVTSRVFTWFFTTFSAGALKRQIVTIKNIPQLYKFIAPDQIDIPPFVSDFDLKVNLEVYQKEVARSTSSNVSEPNCEL